MIPGRIVRRYVSGLSIISHVQQILEDICGAARQSR
jgi:hypothetical protein